MLVGKFTESRMELLTSLLGCFEGCSLFFLLLLEGNVILVNLLLFLFGILARLGQPRGCRPRFL